MSNTKASSPLNIIFFDRDGTLIKNIPYLNDYKLIEYFDDTFSTLKELKAAGYQFVIVTNQSGIPRGLITVAQLTEIHNQMIKDFKKHNIEFLEILYAPHLPGSDHPDRKPNPGMIIKIFNKYTVNKKQSFMVGDSFSDYQAGERAQLKSFIFSSEQPPEINKDRHLYCLADLLKKIPTQ